MTTTRDIIRASLLAPLFVVVPWVALAGVWLALAPAEIRLPWSSFASIAIYFGICLHLFLGALSALIAFSLRRFGTLSIRALLVVSGVFSLAVGAWLGSQSYEEFASASEAGLQFLHDLSER